ncbi:VOC family protein [Kitasatospora kazusensis]|uniref:VOC family protein n=1 Tax=Kitasatospora kazusensis TaxID=407974 RepID=A0ABP5L770_9ACTN
MDLNLSHVMLLVNDQDEALAFYRDTLGFEVRNDVKFEQMRWVTVGPKSQPELEILLETADTRSPADREAIRELVAKGSLGTLIFTTQDCDATFEKLRAAGAEVTQEPVDQPYGVRDCAFRDPSGNHIRFSQHFKS